VLLDWNCQTNSKTGRNDRRHTENDINREDQNPKHVLRKKVMKRDQMDKIDDVVGLDQSPCDCLSRPCSSRA